MINDQEPIGRVAKLQNRSLIFPNLNEYINGCLVYNYHNVPNSKKLRDGWLLIIEAPRPEGMYKESGILVEDKDYGYKIQLVWDPIPIITESTFNISKKLLLDKIVLFNKFSEFSTILNNNPILHEYWLISNVLRSDDSLVMSIIPAFKQLLNLTDIEIMSLLKECKSADQ